MGFLWSAILNRMDYSGIQNLLYFWLSSFFASFAPSLLKTSTSASSLGPASHMVDSLSSLSGLELGSSPATSSNGCSSGFTEAGRTWQVIYSLHWGGRSFSSASFSCFTMLQIVFLFGLEFQRPPATLDLIHVLFDSIWISGVEFLQNFFPSICFLSQCFIIVAFTFHFWEFSYQFCHQKHFFFTKIGHS